MISLIDNPLRLPETCFQVSCRFDKAAYDDNQSEQLGIALPQRLSTAVIKRKAEYLAGRYCVRRAMEKMGVDSRVEVEIGDKREPLWPPGLVGSITHSAGFASAVLARADELAGIGIDSERLIAERTANNVASHILTEAESYEANRELVASAREYLTLVFSAKESIFKCLYPRVKRYFDFHDAQIILNPDTPGEFRFQLRKELTDDLPAGYTGRGQYVLTGDFVHTAIVETAGEEG